MDIFSLVGKITINYADAVNNIEKVSKSAKDTAETLEDVDKKADGAGDSVEDAGQAAKNADSGFTTWKATLANLASTAITKVISGCTQLAEKMADVTKSAVGHYAEYEQLVGGVETLFKDSSGKLIGYAEKAYKTAGMSSNQYMNNCINHFIFIHIITNFRRKRNDGNVMGTADHVRKENLFTGTETFKGQGKRDPD